MSKAERLNRNDRHGYGGRSAPRPPFVGRSACALGRPAPDPRLVLRRHRWWCTTFSTSQRGTRLPDPTTVRGAIFMGGPMSVNDADTLLPLAEEVAWLQRAVALGVPILGICLGAQLLAKAAGATITAAPRPEIGVAPVEITDPDDPLLTHLSPLAHAMHWHGEQFSLPEDAVKLARSDQTEVQAFRLGDSAWGMLFHLEVDDDLLDMWLAEPTHGGASRAGAGPRLSGPTTRRPCGHTPPPSPRRLR